MNACINFILLAYAMEGINAEHVAMLMHQLAGETVFNCMSPQQHSAARANAVRDRLRKQAGDVEVTVIPGRVFAQGKMEMMYTVQVRVKS
jgi:hypothetical protein